MSKVLLLSAACMIAFLPESVSGAGLESAKLKLLYDQNNNWIADDFVVSQNFTGSYSDFDDQAADDFVVPHGHTWRITQVDVSGIYFAGSNYNPTSENVIFYEDQGGMPGDPVADGTFNNLNGTNGPKFSFVLPGKGLKLKPGKYWVSVVVNMPYEDGQWGWDVSSVQHGRQAMWQNPPGGVGVCQTWNTIEICQDKAGPDVLFDLRGSSTSR